LQSKELGLACGSWNASTEMRLMTISAGRATATVPVQVQASSGIVAGFYYFDPPPEEFKVNRPSKACNSSGIELV